MSPETLRRDLERLTVFDWNIKVGRPVPSVLKPIRRVIRKHEPDVLVLHECKTAWRGIVEALPQWQPHVVRGKDEAESTIILVHKDRKVIRSDSVQTNERWIGPVNGWEHFGRTQPWLDLDGGWRVMGLHRVTGSAKGNNLKAWNEEHEALGKFMDRTRTENRKTIIVGDHNRAAYDRGPNSSWNLATNHGFEVVTSGGGVDYAHVLNMRGRGEPLKKWGSDHKARLYHLAG